MRVQLVRAYKTRLFVYRVVFVAKDARDFFSDFPVTGFPLPPHWLKIYRLHGHEVRDKPWSPAGAEEFLLNLFFKITFPGIKHSFYCDFIINEYLT